MKELLQLLRKQFELPQYADAQQRQRAELLAAMLNGGVFLALISTLVTLIAGYSSPWVYLIFLATLGMLLFFRLWLRYGPLDLISYLLVQGGLLLVTVVLITRGTVRSPTAIAYLLVIIAAGLLLDRRALAATVIACSLAVLGLTLAENFGLLPAETQFSPLVIWFTYTAFFILTALFLQIVLRTNLGAFRSAQEELQQRASWHYLSWPRASSGIATSLSTALRASGCWGSTSLSRLTCLPKSRCGASNTVATSSSVTTPWHACTVTVAR